MKAIVEVRKFTVAESWVEITAKILKEHADVFVSKPHFERSF